MFEEREFGGIRYLVKYPKDYRAGEKRPVVFLLHGAGSRGDDLELLKENAYFKVTEGQTDFPFVTVAPQCHADAWFDLWQTLKALSEQVPSFSFCDPQRVYGMGASMGGYGTWQMAMSLPELFAAIVPICGGGMYWNAARLKDLPIWAFHGEKDDVVKVEESVKMVEAVNRSGGCAKLTLYPDCMHDSWNRVYADPTVFSWLLSHSR